MIWHTYSGGPGRVHLPGVVPAALSLAAIGLGVGAALWSRAGGESPRRITISPRAEQMALAATYRSLYRFPATLHP